MAKKTKGTVAKAAGGKKPCRRMVKKGQGAGGDGGGGETSGGPGQLTGDLLFKLATGEADRQTALQWVQAGGRARAGNTKQLAAVKRFYNARSIQEIRIILGACPNKLYCELSGRHRQVLNDQARRYGLPLLGPTINVGEVLRGFHDLIARNKHRLVPWRAEGEDPDTDSLLIGPPTRQLERLRRAKAEREEWTLEREKGKWVRLDEAHTDLAAMANVLRTAGETLRRTFGEQARNVLADALDEIEGMIAAKFTPPAEEKDQGKRKKG